MSAQIVTDECSRINTLQKDYTHYQVLNVVPTANQQQIKRKYYELSLLCHPDRPNNQSNKNYYDEVIKKIISANEVLSNIESRNIYDKHLFTSSSSSSSSSSSALSPPIISGTARSKDAENKQYFGPTKVETIERIAHLQRWLRFLTDNSYELEVGNAEDVTQFLTINVDRVVEPYDILLPEIYPLYRELVEKAIATLLRDVLTTKTKQWILNQISLDADFHLKIRGDIEFLSPSYLEIVLNEHFNDQFNELLLKSIYKLLNEKYQDTKK